MNMESSTLSPEPAMAANASALIRARGVGKVFGGVRVLGEIDADLHAGRVHALLGENGAGKSTFAKIVAGVHQPTEGEVSLDDQVVRFASPLEAQQAGVALIHQEPLSFPHLNVAENIYLSTHAGSTLSRVPWRQMRRQARALLDELNVDLDETRLMGGLPIADQQLVEIAAAFAQNARVVIMDEPTAPLTPSEVGILFDIVRRLKRDGTAIVFISHRLEEVREIADDYTVFRDGRWVASGAVRDVTNADLIRMMIGRDILAPDHVSTATQDVALEVRGLTAEGKFRDVSFDVKRGEVVGFAGLVGAGRTDVARAIFGALGRDAGEITVLGQRLDPSQPADAIAAGLAYVPEDRARDGIFPSLSVGKNITASVVDRLSRLGFMRRRDEADRVGTGVRDLSIRLASVEQPIVQLSGGNQQKAILARWLLTGPDVLILDEPTRGIDIGVKSQFYDEVRRLAESGKAVVVISSELPEVIALSDRIFVMCEGEITAEVARADATEERILAAAVPGGT